MISGIIWVAVGLFVGLHLNRLQHNVLASPKKAEQLASVLRAINQRWIDAGTIWGAWKGQAVSIELSEEEGRALEDAAVFCARFGYLEQAQRELTAEELRRLSE